MPSAEARTASGAPPESQPYSIGPKSRRSNAVASPDRSRQFRCEGEREAPARSLCSALAVCYSLRRMAIDWVRDYCLLLRGTTEQVQWHDELVFKVGGKMFAVVELEPGERWLSFKCTREEFVDLVERPGIVPAPYLARANWVSLETEDALRRAEVERLLGQARDLVFAKLPKGVQAKLLRSGPGKTRSHAREGSRTERNSSDRERR